MGSSFNIFLMLLQLFVKQYYMFKMKLTDKEFKYLSLTTSLKLIRNHPHW